MVREIEYDGIKFEPLFHSEISSSYLLQNIFTTHKDIAADFIKEYFDLQADVLSVFREKSYSKKGSIDIFMD